MPLILVPIRADVVGVGSEDLDAGERRVLLQPFADKFGVPSCFGGAAHIPQHEVMQHAEAGYDVDAAQRGRWLPGQGWLPPD